MDNPVYHNCAKCQQGYLVPIAHEIDGVPYLFILRKDYDLITFKVYCDTCGATGNISYPIMSLLTFKEV